MRYVPLFLLSLALCVVLTGCSDDDGSDNRPPPDNIAPRAANDTAATNANAPVIINVLVNDSDVDGQLEATTVAIETVPRNGTVTVNARTGAVRYTPGTNFAGSDSFTYTVRDDDGATSNAATVTVTVNAAPTPFLEFVQRLLDIPEEQANTLDSEPINDVIFLDQFDETGEPVPLN